MNRRAIATLVLAGFVILSTSAGSGGCGGSSPHSSSSSGSGGSSGGGARSTVHPLATMQCRMDWPDKLRIKPSDSGTRKIIFGTATASCVEAPQSHIVTMHFEKRNSSGVWEQINTSNPDTRRPSLDKSNPTGYFWSVECAPGLWREHAEISGTGSDGTPFGPGTAFPTDKYSPEKVVNASDCK